MPEHLMAAPATTIAVVGCGNIGSRLLQSAAAVEAPSVHVFGVEPFDAARELSAERFAQISRADGGTNAITMVERADDLPPQVDLLVIACSAHQRMDALQAALSQTTPRAVLLEKVLFTKDSDYDRAAALLDGIPAWVNTTRNIWPDYVALASELGDAPIALDVRGSDWGLGSNGIHFLALAELLAGSEVTEITVSDVDARDSKRAGYRELTATLHATLRDGSTAVLSSRPGEGEPIAITLDQGDTRYRINESGGTLSKSVNGAETDARPFTILYTSQLDFALHDMAVERRSGLPTLAQSSRLHRLYLDALRPHVHPQAPDGDLCMVT